MKKRIKTLDTLRGLSMVWMVYGHAMDWFLIKSDIWYFHVVRAMFDVLGSGSFLFISGVSMCLSVRTRNAFFKYSYIREVKKSFIRNEYYLRAVFMYLVALGYNVFVSIMFGDPSLIWNWFILQTIAISILLAWPLLKTSIYLRFLLIFLIWIVNFFLLSFLQPYDGDFSFMGISFHIFYGSLDLDPILAFFPFFLMGTIIGDILFKVNMLETEDEKFRAQKMVKSLLIPSSIIGGILITTGITISFPIFLQHRSYSWLIYSMGLILVIVSSLTTLEYYGLFESKKRYRFFFYFSYYSLSVYLVHNLMYFAFYRSLNWIVFQPVTLSIIILSWLLLRFFYSRKWGSKLSIKVQLSRLATGIAVRIADKNTQDNL